MTTTADVTIQLDAGVVDVGDPAAVAARIPPASTLEPRARVVVLASAVRRRGVIGRLLGGGRVEVPRAVRCTALLVRGYVDIGADEAGAWGHAPALS